MGRGVRFVAAGAFHPVMGNAVTPDALAVVRAQTTRQLHIHLSSGTGTLEAMRRYRDAEYGPARTAIASRLCVNTCEPW